MPPTTDTTAGLAARLAEMEERLSLLQHENMMKEQEALRLRCRLADFTQLLESFETLPKRARTDSDSSNESSFTKRNYFFPYMTLASHRQDKHITGFPVTLSLILT